MGRKFENNKMKMAKTAAAYNKKASYIGKKILQCVKQSGPELESNRQLGLLIKEANKLGVTKDVVNRSVWEHMERCGVDYFTSNLPTALREWRTSAR